MDHLSTFNLDLLKTDQACVRIDASGLTDAALPLEVTIPGDPFPVVRTTTLDNSTTTLHALYNLPTDTWIAIRAFREAGGTPTPLGTFIVNTGGPQQPTDPNQPVYPYDACRAEVGLVDLGASVALANREGDPSQTGLLIPVYMGIVNRTTGDLLPAGTAGFPVVGIFDPGSNSVYITSDTRPNGFTDQTPSDAVRLGVTQAQEVTFRLTPVDLAPTPETAPMGASGSPTAAAAELASVRIRVDAGRDLSLAGAPFVTTHIGYVDYAVGVSIPGSQEIGAWSRYFLPGAPGVPLADVEIPMVRFGATTPTAPAGFSWAQRFLLQGVTFYHQGNRVGHAVAGSNDQMFFDPGTRQTMISDAVANALGLTTPLLDDCGTGVFRVDSIALVGPGGRYVVSDAIVCRNDAGMAQVGGGNPPERSEAIIGASLFRRMAIVVDGPGNRLGILRP